MRYSFTGTARELSHDEQLYVSLVMGGLVDLTEAHTGAAFGIDTACAWAAVLFHPNAEHHVWVPGTAWHNEDVPLLFNGAGHHVHIVPDACRPSRTYMHRNDELVAHADCLVAFPETANEVQRSGTWATIRRARAAGIEVRLFPLDTLTRP